MSAIDPAQVSVVIPAHDVAPWVEAALASVAAQTRRPAEVVVVDDASADATADAAGRAFDAHLRPAGVEGRVVAGRFGNAGPARNAGVAAAAGGSRWIAFLDADDVWYPEHLATALGALAADPRHVAFVGRHRRLEPGGAEEQSRPLAADDGRHDGLDGGDLARVMSRKLTGFPTPGMVVRRDRFEAVGGFDAEQRRRHDFELFLRLVAEPDGESGGGHRWCCSREATWRYTADRPGSISSRAAECLYFKYRALRVNADRFAGHPAAERFRRRYAKVCVSGLIRDGEDDLARRALAEAWPDLSPVHRAAYWLGVRAPRLVGPVLDRINPPLRGPAAVAAAGGAA